MHKSLKAIFDALNILKAADPKLIESISTDIEALEKSSGLHGSASLESSQDVVDRWTQGNLHKVPGKEVINTGPSEHSSGGGAEKMVRDYSSTVPQTGITLEAIKIGKELDALATFTKGAVDKLMTLHKSQDDRLTALVGAVEKLAKAMPTDEDDDSTTVGLARTLVGDVRDLVASFDTAKAALAKAEEEDEEDEKKSCKSDVKRIRKAISEKLEAAAALNVVGKSEKIAKSIQALARRADITVKAMGTSKEDDDVSENEAEEKEKKLKKAAEDAAALAAKTGDTPAADVTAITAAVEQMQKAAEGLGMMTTDVKGFFESLVAGVSKAPMKTPPATFELMKADAGAVITQVQDRIDSAREAGIIDNIQEMRGRDLLSKYSAVRGGHFPESTFQEILKGSAPAVQELFKLAA